MATTRKQRNTTPITFGKAIDMIDEIHSTQEQRIKALANKVREKDHKRIDDIIKRCDEATQERVLTTCQLISGFHVASRS